MLSLNDILFCILSRSHSKYYGSLASFLLHKNINVFYLKDNEHYTDTKELINAGFKNLNNIGKRFSEVIAWDKIFYHIYINKLTNKYKYFYIIEDDVYAKNLYCFLNLINDWNAYEVDLISYKIQLKSESVLWPHWNKLVPSILNPTKSLNPLCRLSYRLIDTILSFCRINNSFIFQEILFASLANQYNLSIIDYALLPNKDTYLSNIVWSKYLLKTIDIKSNKIYHPNKNATLLS